MIQNRIAIVSLLTGLNFLNYIDRYIVAAVLPRIQKDLALSDLEGGLLATAFLLGFFLTSPLFGMLGDRVPRKWLIALGVLLWSAATIASGLATNLGTLVLARIAVGIGEASYVTLAPTIIDDIAPPDRKGRLLAIFFLAIPLGSALGYLTGGFVQDAWGWREAFFVGGAPGLVLAFVCLAIAEPARTLSKVRVPIARVVAVLAKIAIYRRAVFGYCAHTAAIGAFSFWAPTFLARRFADDFAANPLAPDPDQILKSANFWFGLVTVAAGTIGTIIGGRLADRAVRALPPVPPDASHEDPANRRIANAQLRVCAIGVAIAFPFAALSFVAPSAATFFALAGICEIGLFMSTAPINMISLRTAPPYLRASSQAILIFSIHLFGDLWSPSLLGFLLDRLHLIAAMMALPIGFAIATAVWWPRAREAR